LSSDRQQGAADFWARWPLRRELREITELLETHVELGLETGTDPKHIRALLREVRRAVLQVLPREDA